MELWGFALSRLQSRQGGWWEQGISHTATLSLSFLIHKMAMREFLIPGVLWDLGHSHVGRTQCLHVGTPREGVAAVRTVTTHVPRLTCVGRPSLQVSSCIGFKSLTHYLLAHELGLSGPPLPQY